MTFGDFPWMSQEIDTSAPATSDMALTTAVPQGSAGWLERLVKVLDARSTDMTRFNDYYEGRHPLVFTTSIYRKEFGQLLRGFADNFCGLVVDAEAERLHVEGFRMGSRLKNLQADEDAWRIWQVNQLDAWSGSAHTEMLVKGEVCAIVSPFVSEWPDEKTPLITIEDPTEVVVETSTANRRLRLAALKRWRDDDGRRRATLYLPDRFEKYIERRDERPTSAMATTVNWVPLRVEGEAWPLPNPIGVVPVVPLVNRPRLNGSGRSELTSVVPIQDTLNKLFMDMLFSADANAFRQRWATGIEIPLDPETGQTVETFRTAIDRIWSTVAPDAKFGDFDETKLEGYRGAIEMAVQHVASITRTPAHYLMGQSGTFPSGESLKTTETGLVAKTLNQSRYTGEGWEEVVRLAFRSLDDPRGKIQDSETIWADMETRTEAEHVDALVKMGSLGVPQEVLWERWDATPQEIIRWKALNDAAKAEEAAETPDQEAVEPPEPVETDGGMPMMAMGPIASRIAATTSART
jgi:hypothetical protein